MVIAPAMQSYKSIFCHKVDENLIASNAADEGYDITTIKALHQITDMISRPPSMNWRYFIHDAGPLMNWDDQKKNCFRVSFVAQDCPPWSVIPES